MQDQLFTHLARHSKILVTGPQRSGTTICAKMIAADTGHDYVDEDEIGVDDLSRLRERLAAGERIVVQCPALCRFVHELADSRTAVVLMRRPVEEIVASQRRIGWNAERLELRRYGLETGVIANVKYDFWEKHQRGHIEHAYEVTHESLAAHPLWVEKTRRVRFRPRQTC
jgi:hypothetical protein